MASRILVIGGTGMVGQQLVAASINAGHPTAVLVRPPACDDPVKAKLVDTLCNNGASLVYGDINDRESLVSAIKDADVVISAVGHTSPELEILKQMYGPPVTRVTVYGDGKHQAMFVNEKDMCTLAIKAIDDPRTLHKILYVRPAVNLCSLDQLVSLWEKKIGNDLEKCYVAEEELTGKIQASPFPLNFQLAMVHWTFLAETLEFEQITVSNDASDDDGVEATVLYPDMKYVTVEEYLDNLK
uniref:NmrA-like domain-containing protein n=1 Tax=Leersia perrieri TaxID=77586 RepID=A0A0D9UYT8_9ORYZ